MKLCRAITSLPRKILPDGHVKQCLLNCLILSTVATLNYYNTSHAVSRYRWTLLSKQQQQGQLLLFLFSRSSSLLFFRLPHDLTIVANWIPFKGVKIFQPEEEEGERKKEENLLRVSFMSQFYSFFGIWSVGEYWWVQNCFQIVRKFEIRWNEKEEIEFVSFSNSNRSKTMILLPAIQSMRASSSLLAKKTLKFMLMKMFAVDISINSLFCST